MTKLKFGRVVELITAKSTNSAFKIGLEDIEAGTGKLREMHVEYDGDGVDFRPDDVLFGKLRPYLAKSWLADRSGNAVGDFHVYRPRPGAVPRYVHYVTLSRHFLEPVMSSVFGAKMPRASWDFVREVEIDFPPEHVQRTIADYLDRETAQIDTLIAKQEQLISRFQERRDAGWAWALTSVADSAPSTTLRRMIVSIADGPFGSSLTSAHYSDSGARVIRLGNVGINEFKNEDQAFVPIEYFRELLAHEARAGDVIIAGLGDDQAPLGRAAVLPEVGPAIVKADCYRVRPRPEVDSAYLAWALSTPQLRHQFSLLARGATRARLNTAVVQQAVIPLPPLDEQRRIVAYLDEQTAKIDTLIAKAQRFIELAKERREALITAAVTGQLDVTAA